MTLETLKIAQRDMKELRSETVAFLENIGFIKHPTYTGDVNTMLHSEGKREIVLTLLSMRDMTEAELLEHFTINEGD